MRRPQARGKARGRAWPRVLSAAILLGHSMGQEAGGRTQRDPYLGKNPNLEVSSKLGTVLLNKGL